jgi:hypothetical protein
MKLELDSDHIYRLDGRKVPGFTQIAQNMGLIPDMSFATVAGRDEGTALHEWCDFAAQGLKPDADPDPRIAPRYTQFLKFLAETEFKRVGSESLLYHPMLGYCGKPDLWGTLAGRNVIIDIKGGARLPFHALQLAAYRILLREGVGADGVPVKFGLVPASIYTLYLSDENYRLSQVEYPALHERNWGAIVAAYHAKKHYIKGEKNG